MKRQFLLITVAGLTFLLYQGCESSEFVSAKMYVQQEELDNAEEFFLKALELEAEKDNAKIPFLLARDVYARQSRFEEMSQMLEEALRRNASQRFEGSTIEELVQEVRERESNIEYNRGAELYNKILQATRGEEPNEQELEQLKQARGHFETAIFIWPEGSRSYVSLAFCCRQLGDKDGERAAVEQALQKIPDNGRVLLLAGELAWEEGDREQALEFYRRAYEIMPDDVDVMRLLTSAYTQVGDSQAALEILEEARRGAPQDPNIYFNLGVVYTGIGNDALEKGQDLYREAVGADVTPIDKLEAAITYFEQAQEAFSEALYFMDNVLALRPDDTGASQISGKIQSTRKILDTLQRSAEGIIRENQ